MSTNITDADQTEADIHIQHHLSLHGFKLVISTQIHTTLHCYIFKLKHQGIWVRGFSSCSMKGDSPATFSYQWQITQTEKNQNLTNRKTKIKQTNPHTHKKKPQTKQTPNNHQTFTSLWSLRVKYAPTYPYPFDLIRFQNKTSTNVFGSVAKYQRGYSLPQCPLYRK